MLSSSKEVTSRVLQVFLLGVRMTHCTDESVYMMRRPIRFSSLCTCTPVIPERNPGTRTSPELKQHCFSSGLVLVPGLRSLCVVCLVADEVANVLMQYALHLGLCQLLCSMLWCTCTRHLAPWADRKTRPKVHLSPCRYVSPLPDILAGIAGFPPRSVIETVWIVEEIGRNTSSTLMLCSTGAESHAL